jgi:hypothetical protein
VYCGLRRDRLNKRSLHKFPLRRKTIFQKWLNSFSKQGFVLTAKSALCSDHFEARCFNKPGCLKPNAVPTIFLATNDEVHLEISEATFEDKSSELDYDPVDYVNKIKTEVDDGNVYLRSIGASFGGNVNETSHDRADYVSEGKTEPDDIDIEEKKLNETDYVYEIKTEVNDVDVHVRSTGASVGDHVNETSHDRVDYVSEIKTEPDDTDIEEEELNETDYVDEIKIEVDDGDVHLRSTGASFGDNVNETRHDRADYLNEVKTEPDDLDIEEELGNLSPINSVHERKRKRLDIKHASMDFADAVKAMKSPLQEDEDLVFLHTLLPLIRSLDTDQKCTFRLKTVQLLQDLRNSFRINASSDLNI